MIKGNQKVGKNLVRSSKGIKLISLSLIIGADFDQNSGSFSRRFPFEAGSKVLEFKTLAGTFCELQILVHE